MSTLNIEMHGVYRNKRGESVMIVDTVGTDSRWDYECGMRFKDHLGCTYRPDGTYNNVPGENQLDLSEQVTDSKELVKIYNSRMTDIYDADRDYEICLADLPQDKQDQYNELKARRTALSV